MQLTTADVLLQAQFNLSLAFVAAGVALAVSGAVAAALIVGGVVLAVCVVIDMWSLIS